MGFGVIPYITRVFFLIPWRFFPGSEVSWYKEHLTNVTQDVKITWKMEGLPYQWQKVAYSGGQERVGFPWKQFCKSMLVLVLGKNILGWSCSVALHVVYSTLIVVVSEKETWFHVSETTRWFSLGLRRSPLDLVDRFRIFRSEMSRSLTEQIVPGRDVGRPSCFWRSIHNWQFWQDDPLQTFTVLSY